jgi:flagellar hook-basal body complex protein FliE
VIGTIGAVAGLLDESIKLFNELRDARKRQKNLPKLIDKYSKEVYETHVMVDIVQHAHGLNTEGVNLAIAKLGKVAEALRDHLKKMASVGGKIRGFVHQFTSGKKDEEALKDVMVDLENAKGDLNIYITISNVGILERVGDSVSLLVPNTFLVTSFGRGLSHVIRLTMFI